MKLDIRITFLYLCILFITQISHAAADYRVGLLRSIIVDNGFASAASINPKFDTSKANVGEFLFNDSSMSFNSDTSCSTCHLSEFGSSDGLPIAVGVGGMGSGIERLESGGAVVPRNTLPLWGRASPTFNSFFWDGKVELREGRINSQYGLSNPFPDPITTAISLPFVEIRELINDDALIQAHHLLEDVSAGQNIQQELTKRVTEDTKLLDKIRFLYDVNAQTLQFSHLMDALKHFLIQEFPIKTTKLEKFIDGTVELTDSEIEGGLIFYGKGKCSACHNGPHFSDFNYYIIPTPQIGSGKNGFGVDYGRFNVTHKKQDLYKFRTPPLHNITSTAPYGHSGSLPTLRAAIRAHYDPFYNMEPSSMSAEKRTQLYKIFANIELDQPIPSNLTGDELENLVSFIKTLDFVE